MTTKNKIIIAVVALAAAFAAGRWAAPEKVKIEKKTVEVEKKVDTTQTDTNRNRRTETTTTQVKKPDGTVETTTKTVTEAQTNTQTDRKDSTQLMETQTASKEITRASAKVTVSALAGVHLSLSNLGTTPPLAYGAAITKPILGPLTVGVFYLTPGVLGSSVGLTF